jgi:heptosyltransferase-2
MPIQKIRDLFLVALEPLIYPRVLVCLLEPVFTLLGRRKGMKNANLHEQTPRKLLVIQIDRIGDCVLTTPLLRQLRKLYPQSEITLLCEQSTNNLFTHCPYIDRILSLDTRSFSLWWKVNYFFLALKESLKLWRYNFDLVIYPHWDADYYCSSFLSYLCGARWRLAFSEHNSPSKAQFNSGYDLFFSHTLLERNSLHEVDSNLSLLKLLQKQPSELEKEREKEGGEGAIQNAPCSREPELWLSAEDQAFARSYIEKHNLTAGNFVALCLGGSHPRKYWPDERYLEIAFWLIKEHAFQILFVGSGAEKNRSEKIADQIKATFPGAAANACGQTSLRECQALMSLGRLYLGNDTGPMHIAGAHNIPVVELCAHALNLPQNVVLSPHRFGPITQFKRILQPEKARQPCQDAQECQGKDSHCIEAITTHEVQHALSSLLVDLEQQKQLNSRQEINSDN